MRSFLVGLCVALSLVGLSAGISITEAEIVGNLGDDEETPIAGGKQHQGRLRIDRNRFRKCVEQLNLYI